ncbi:aminoglycoside phosphotransferase [Trichosporon asahii var. asahii CBS 2479]|uniref:Aminoglycoside phosphotransferase n=1 Tax=Trichosporon asahii var. asahii (strain ATCC 90039 / CBS 2479 / JCM 2466 / KCTC 7840 / NBRC 103889/ NCYC 2677 / UAMH 7654) TaxID=1186058 RepID=J4U564_TRIAS|nr:aminoglycoside phosphotransferase [Trichosporon asahii var. asahii CBS 2479]EJT45050.1 aminoglycoside phosphotransferase [Trichosporon asahii var. asahii CBS 2479]
MSPPTAELQAAGLTPAQAEFVEDKLGRVTLVKNMSWGNFDSTVLHVARKVGPFVIKACGPGIGRHHFDRELAAFRAGVTDRLGSHAARLLHVDEGLGVMVLNYLPGSLVFGSPFQLDPDTHRQAGRLLRQIHSNPQTDTEWDAKATRRSLDWLDKEHRIPEPDAALTRLILEDRISTPHPVEVVDTHGDYHPRNWLRDDAGTVRVIDWGRYERRPAFTDFIRCACQEWAEKPELGHAFAEGYGQDLRDTDDWKMEYLRQAVGTACWAPTIGDEKFEAQGIRMVAEALELLRPLAARLQSQSRG